MPELVARAAGGMAALYAIDRGANGRLSPRWIGGAGADDAGDRSASWLVEAHVLEQAALAAAGRGRSPITAAASGAFPDVVAITLQELMAQAMGADASRLASLLGLEIRRVFRRPRASPSGRLDAHLGR